MKTQELILSANLEYLMRVYGGLSVSELARQSGVPQPTLHHILSGTTKHPRAKALESIAKFFSVSVSQLIGEVSLPKIIPANLQADLKISTVPIISWDEVKKWPKLLSVSDEAREKVITEKKVGNKSFGLIMRNQSIEPLFPIGSILIFDPDKKPKDRDFVIVYSTETNEIIFNRLFIDGNEYYIKLDKSASNEMKLLRLNFNKDQLIATIVEARVRFD